MKQLLYFSVKIFFHSILSIFFREVNIIGHHNIPRYGPVIFTSNHANQFMDSVVVLSTCQRTISFLMAESSYMKKIVGHIAWAMGVVPVKRAQDSAVKGLGVIRIEKWKCHDDDNDDRNNEENEEESTGEQNQQGEPKSQNNGSTEYKIIGTNTQFKTQIKPKDKIRFKNCPNGLKVKSIQSDNEMIATGIDSEFGHDQYQSLLVTTTKSENNEHNIDSPMTYTYELLKRIEQSEVYEKVIGKLAEEGAIGIFPEGGSHDRTDLLPLKAGVALIAYSALEKDGLVIPIVPVGLNYFHRHKIRGRVTVEYGRPIFIDPATLNDYTKGGDSRRKVCNEVLQRYAC
jgi:glycerol-3-phosphate O-acyltransferase/dihydroxyacetone phosphate acyltransferase